MTDLIISFAVLIALIAVCVIWGRIFCGRICPIGYSQDFLFKIPFPKKLHQFKVDKYLRYIKYPVFVLWVDITGSLSQRSALTEPL